MYQYYWHVLGNGRLIVIKQLEEIVSSIRNNRISVGELNPQDLQKVCFLNERYKRITISDIEKTTNLLNILQGPAVEPRKKYIYENAKDLGFEFD